MRVKKSISIILLIAVIASLSAGCGRVEVPDIMGKDEKTAVKMVKEAQFVPIVEYEYRDSDEKGKVFRTRPKANATAKKNSEVVIYISQGPENILSKSAYCQWTSMGKTNDKWEFTLPYIDEGVLYIDCQNVVINDLIEWIESDETSVSSAEVSLTEDFAVSIPAKIKFSKDVVDAGEAQRVIFAVPVADIKAESPEKLFFKFNWNKNGVSEEFKIDFNITW